MHRFSDQGFMMDETLWNILLISLSLVVVVLVYEFIKLKVRRKKEGDKCPEDMPALSDEFQLLTHCQSSDCFRCSNNHGLLQKALTRLSYYARDNEAGNDAHNLSMDIRKSIERLKNKAQATEFSGMTTSSPVVFKMSGLREDGLWSLSDFPALQILETSFKNINIEFTNLYKSPLPETRCLWKSNSTPSGKWEIAQLIDQGRKTKAAELCPMTMELLNKIPYFIRGNVFGDASFSVVHPGTYIATHCGSTNFRIRCHLGLKVPGNDCTLKVGDKTIRWEESKVICFNDAFPHSVHHRGSGDSGIRAVFLLDLWHPDVTDSQVDVLNYAFSV